MDFYNVLNLLCGLAFFLFGMQVMSHNLERLSGGRLEGTLKKMTANPLISLGLGAVITIAMQSSSASTVMLVGLVNSGIMHFSQTLNVIFGANIGTTLTAWLLSLTGIESDNIFLAMLKPANFSPLLALVGVFMIMLCKRERNKSIGNILVGFAVLMIGMNFMSDAVAPLADMPEFAALMVKFRNPALGVIVGALFTALIQSSAASVGILQALAGTGSITYGMAIPSSWAEYRYVYHRRPLVHRRQHRRQARGHYAHPHQPPGHCHHPAGVPDPQRHFPSAHPQYAHRRLRHRPVSHHVQRDRHSHPDAQRQAHHQAHRVAHPGKGRCRPRRRDQRHRRAGRASAPLPLRSRPRELQLHHPDVRHRPRHLQKAFGLLEKYSEDAAQDVAEQEDIIDLYEDRLGTFLVRLSSRELSSTDSHSVSLMLHSIGDFERLGDHAVNIQKVAEEMWEKKLTFSDEAHTEIRVLLSAIEEILQLTETAFTKNDLAVASRVEPLEQVVDKLIAKIKDHHIERLQRGECTIEMGFILSDLLNNCERVSDHCSNIAVALIEVDHNSFDTHKYLNDVKYGSADFADAYSSFAEKYAL